MWLINKFQYYLVTVTITRDYAERTYLRVDKSRMFVRQYIYSVKEIELNRFGVALNINTRQRILQAFISPKFIFCLPVWGHLNKTCTSTMNQAQQLAARVVLYDKATVLNCDTYSSTGLLPFDYIIQLSCAVRVNALLSNDDYTSYLPPLLANNGSQFVTRDITGERFNVPTHKLAASEFWSCVLLHVSLLFPFVLFLNFFLLLGQHVGF